MAKLIYGSNVSLDGCTEDQHGAFDWAPPDDDLRVAVGNSFVEQHRCVVGPPEVATGSLSLAGASRALTFALGRELVRVAVR